MKLLMKSVFLAVALGLVLPSAMAVPPGYVLKDLGTLQTLPTCVPPQDPTVDPCAVLSESSGQAVNNNGHVVGSSDTGGINGTSGLPQTNAFLHDGASMQDLGTLGAGDVQSVATSVNDSDQVVGFSDSDTGARTAFLYDPGSIPNMDLIPAGTGNLGSIANDINNGGQVVGFALFDETDCGPDPLNLPHYEANRAFVYDKSQSPNPTYLTLLPASAHDFAYGINQAGQIAGYSLVPGVDPDTGDPVVDADGCPLFYSTRAFLYDLATSNVTAVGGTSGALSGGTWSEAYAINSAGEVVGDSGVGDVTAVPPSYDQSYHAFQYTATGGMVDLGTLTGGMTSVAHGINDDGEIVGFGDTATSPSHAFVYDPAASAMHDLNDLITASGWELTQAWAVNEKGQITGDGVYTYDDPDLGTVSVARAYLLTPDSDGDGVGDAAVGDPTSGGDPADNCKLVSNADQRDTNGDGFGNVCDADLNNDGIVNTLDFGLFRKAYGSTGPNLDADFNGDGIVNTLDFGLFRKMYGAPPGP